MWATPEKRYHVDHPPGGSFLLACSHRAKSLSFPIKRWFCFFWEREYTGSRRYGAEGLQVVVSATHMASVMLTSKTPLDDFVRAFSNS